MDSVLPRMMEAAGITKELKARDPMRWVGLRNTMKAQAEESIFQELITDRHSIREAGICRHRAINPGLYIMLCN